MTKERIKCFKEIVLPFFTKFFLKINYENLGESDAEEFKKDFNKIIELAAKALEQEPCDDAISRQAAIDAINKIHPVDTEYDCTLYDKIDVMYVLKDLPSVTPQPKMGRWIFDKILDKHYYCSECKSMGVDYWDYCPSCGAKMESEE